MQKSKILIVDDNEINREICEEILCDDYQLAVAQDGESALEVARGFEPDLVLLDVMMPGISGIEVCRQLRQSVRPWVKIIMVSAKSLVEDRLEGFDAGADDYVTKPFDEQELLAKVRVHLQLKRVEEIDSVKDKLLDVLQHSNRTPLTSILMNAGALAQASEPMDAVGLQEAGITIQRSAERLLTWLEAGEQYVELKSNAAFTNFASIDFSALVQRCADAAAEQAGSNQEPVTIVPNIEAGLYGELDQRLTTRMLQSVLRHACGISTSASEVGVSVEQVGEKIVFNVRCDDAGSTEPLELAFEPFGLPDENLLNKSTGLDMAIAREIAHLHQGRIEAFRQSDGVLVFQGTLPICTSTAMKSEAAEIRQPSLV